MSTADRLPYVEAELNYIVPTTERPRYYAYEPGPADPPPNMVHEAHTVRIHDMRPITSEIGLDQQGFALVEQRSAVRDFWDDDEVRQVYYPEAERFIAEVMGASRVFIFDHVQRRRGQGGVWPRRVGRLGARCRGRRGAAPSRRALPRSFGRAGWGRAARLHLRPWAAPPRRRGRSPAGREPAPAGARRRRRAGAAH